MTERPPMLELAAVDAGYGGATVLRGVSFSVEAGEIHCLLGRNGAGKSTALKAIMGHLPLTAGEIRLGGEAISRLPAHKVPTASIGYVPQGRRLFGELTVRQNLEIGAFTRRDGAAQIARQLELFPRLQERLAQRAQTLSGGEQQMLAMARALCLEPRVLLLDEPTEGLQPSMIDLIRQVIVRMRAKGVAILLVEQRVEAVLSVADRVTFIENGVVRETLAAGAARNAPDLLHRYIGI